MKKKQEVKKIKSKESSSEFKREIGLFDGVSIIAGIMLGSGIFYIGSYVLQRTDMNLGLSLLCWILGGLISLLGGICFAELGASRPVAGGGVVYLNEAYHPIVGYMQAFSSMLVSGAGSIAALAIAIPASLKTLFNLSDIAVKGIAIVLIVLFTIPNLFGVKRASSLQSILMVAKLIPIIVIITGALIFGKQTPNLSLLPTSSNNVNFSSMLGTIAFGTVAALWAYEGWANLNTVAEEIKKPDRNLPLAIIIAISGITVLYALFNLSIFKVIPYEQIVSMIRSGDLYLGTEVAKQIFGNIGGIIVIVGMVISMLGCLNGMILAFPRAYYAMAKDGHFFDSYRKIHPKYKVPTAPIIGQCVISSILVLLRSLDQLTSMVVFIGMLFNTLILAAVIIYRRKFPDLKRPYKVWGYPFTVIVAILIFMGLMINTFMEDPVTALIGIIVPAIGAVVYTIFDKQLKKNAQEKYNEN